MKATSPPVCSCFAVQMYPFEPSGIFQSYPVRERPHNTHVGPFPRKGLELDFVAFVVGFCDRDWL
jgi:hypothetical protein